MATFYDLLNCILILDADALKFEGRRNRQQRVHNAEPSVFAMQNIEGVRELSTIETNAEDKDEVDQCWRFGEQTTDARLSRPEEAFHGCCSVRIPRGSNLARYFVAFLPINHIESVVILPLICIL
ncbi:hypothetical protein [Parasitella parasitica]|uniref:Uncharacterized protein n=1 Tax=Parasitella parasitica TaxID=35722 RepID=A0A0B7NVN3_9FUNG|nr:hypothetical protein [Parasitella parasitica]